LGNGLHLGHLQKTRAFTFLIKTTLLMFFHGSAWYFDVSVSYLSICFIYHDT